MIISYDYEELIGEILEDVAEGLLELSNPMKVMRNDKSLNNANYFPIVDYYYLDDPCDEKFEEMLVADALTEMREWNRIL